METDTLSPPSELRPQQGKQMDFLASPADLGFFGGGAFGGKTFGLLMEPLRNIKNGKFSAAIFRRTEEAVTQRGGLWDTAEMIYPQFGGIGTKSELTWTFPSGMRVSFHGMKDEKDKLKWQGAQIPLICFDEATHFTMGQITYMMSRNRSNSGIPGYMRFTCNPDPDSFVAEWIDWWIGDDGYPIKERSGKLRWFIRRGFNMEWGDSRQELIDKYGPEQEPKSITFIPSLIRDNPIGMANDPGYMSNLKALSHVDRMQLLEGNWKVRAVAGSYFRPEWFPRVDALPVAGIVGQIRFWDRAGTRKTETNDPDQTCCIKLLKYGDGRIIVADYKTWFATPYEVEVEMKRLAITDGPQCTVGWMRDPGSAGVKESQDTAWKLSGYPLFILDGAEAQKSKEVRCKPVSSQCQAGNIACLTAEWTNRLMRNLEGFPEGRYKEEADCMSGGFDGLNRGPAAASPPPREHDYSFMGQTSRMAV